MLNKALRLISILSVLGLLILTLSGRGCPKRSRNKIGSSNEWAGIAAPSSLTATAFSSSEIRLSWQDNSNNEDGFAIERRTSATGYFLLATVGANTTSYPDTTVVPFTVYYYLVRAFNTIGDYSNYSNEVSAITVRPEWQSIAAGEFHSLAINNNGSLWVWGYNLFGQLGLGDASSYTITIPTLLGSDTDWKTIAAGYNHTLALKTDLPDGQAGSALWSWGTNDDGELGLGDTNYRTTPSPVGTDSDWSIVAGGTYHTIALKTGGTLWAWGSNLDGQLGIGGTIEWDFQTQSWRIMDPQYQSRTTPTQIGTDTDWINIAAGGRHNIALKTDRTMWTWGWNYWSQLGDGTLTARTTPCQIGTDSDWLVVSAGYIHTIALKTTGTLWQWGNEEYGSSTPAQLGTDTDWLVITAGGTIEDTGVSYHSLALKTNSTIWAWGPNNYGQLGLGDYLERSAPIQIGTSSDWAAVTAGGWHNLARTNDGSAQPPDGSVGTLWVWGRNNLYQLGLGNTINQLIPINTNLPQPGNLAATVISYTQITLSWPDNSFNETGFKIERSFDGITYELLTTPDANIILYDDSTVTQGNTYYYRIKAAYPAGDSAYSNVAVVVTRFWTENPASGGTPTARRGHSMVWDGTRMIMFGGIGGSYRNDLWWYEPVSNTWTEKIAQGVGSSPSARNGHSMVWDGTPASPAGGRVIMFGGRDGVNKNDLWWYAPVSNTWSEKIAQGTGSSPSVRNGHSMVWDPVGQRVIMFGGGGTSPNYKNDLWWYEPVSNTWIEKITQYAIGSPAVRSGHSMVWDPVGERVIMFGGEGPSNSYKNDLWWYEPISNTWTEKTPSGSPTVRWGHSMVWDPDVTSGRVIMFGGFEIYTIIKNDLWWYEPVSNTWSEKIVQGAVGSPTARYGHSMIWDQTGQRMIMFGGFDGSYRNDLWWWW